AAARPGGGPAASRRAPAATRLPRRKETAAWPDARRTGRRRGREQTATRRTRCRCPSSGAERMLPDLAVDVGRILDHPDLFRQLEELVDDFGVLRSEGAGHVGTLSEPPLEELGR